MLIGLVLATPFIDMSGYLDADQRRFRVYAYLIVAMLELVLIALRGWKISLIHLRTPVVVFLTWCAASLLWTQHFDLTLKRLALLCIVYIGMTGCVVDLGERRSIRVIQAILVLALVVNFVGALLFPEIGTHALAPVHLWRGFMAHKNIAGMLCAITIIFFIFDRGKLFLPLRAAVILSSCIFFYLAWSKTTLATLPIALACGWAIVWFGKRQRSWPDKVQKNIVIGCWVVGIVSVGGFILATLQQDFFLSLTNDTTAVTKRGAIWRPMIQFYLDHPLLGSGYGAYWDASAQRPDNNAPALGIWNNVDQGHNGYLDLLVQVGLPGLVLALYIVVICPMQRLLDVMVRSPRRAALVFSTIVFLIGENFAESSIFADDSLGNAFLLISLAYLNLSKLRNAEPVTSGGWGSATESARSAVKMRVRRQRRNSVLGREPL